MAENIHVYLTDRVIARTPAPEVGETRLLDTEFKGFFVRVWPSGRKSFCIRYRRTKAPELYTIGTFGSPWTTADARAKAGDIFRHCAENDKAASERKAGHTITINEMCHLYLTDGPIMKVGKRKSSWRLDACNLRHHVEPLIGKRIVSDLKRSDIARMLHDISNGATAGDIKTKKQGVARVRGGPVSAERVLSSLRAMLNWAIAQDYLSNNPAKGITLPKRALKERFLSDEEAFRLFAVLEAGVKKHTINPQHSHLIQLLLLTGARKSELMNLRWEEIELQRSRLVLPPERTKSGRHNGWRRIPLSIAAKNILAIIPRVGSDFVFPSDRSNEKPMTGINKTWKRVCDDANFGHMRLHDLRHSFASFAIANGENIVHIAAALGHASTRMTERYLHLRDHEVRALADRTGQRIMSGIAANLRRAETYPDESPFT